jgi:thioredoxin reductase
MGEKYQSKTIIISTGLKDILPSIGNISDFFGKSLFNCPYCDGWELKDKPLVVIVDEQKQGFHYTQIIYNWSKIVHSTEQKELLQNKGIKIIELKIKNFIEQNGQIEQLVFENGETVSRKGGFVLTQWIQSSDFGKELGCENNSLGGIATDSFGRTNITGVYEAGKYLTFHP